MDCSLPGSSIHGIFQARVLEWGAIAFSESAMPTLGLSWGGPKRTAGGEEAFDVLGASSLCPFWWWVWEGNATSLQW